MQLKQQSAVEFLVTYSWAIIAISLFVVSVLVLADTRAPINYLQSTCNIQPLLPCQETLLAYNSPSPIVYYIVFTNQLGSVLYFPPNAITLSTPGSATGTSITASQSTGNCQPSFASPSVTVFCTVNLVTTSKPAIGSETIVNFAINYNICSTDNSISCAPGLYKSSGYSVQDVAPIGVKLNNITFATVPSGTVIINGVTYFKGTSAYLTSGNYVIYAQPPSGQSFRSWSVTNSVSTSVASTSSQNTILVVSSNAFVTATFT